jgi:hypothetical protein
MNPGVKRFASKERIVARDERARLQVLLGPDKGATFVLQVSAVRLGRSDEADVVLNDPKASRIHVSLTEQSPQQWLLKHLGESNPTQMQGQSLQEARIESGAEFKLGQTSFRFLIPGQIPRLTGPHASITPPEAGKKKALPLPIFLVLFGGVAWFLMESGLLNETSSIKASSSAKKAEDSVGPVLPLEINPGRTLDAVFKEGMREYYSANYRRAKVQFETILQINPRHRLAKIYLENAKKALDTRISIHLERGKQALDSGKILKAKGHYESIVRILSKEPDRTQFKEAQDQLVKVQKILGTRE